MSDLKAAPVRIRMQGRVAVVELDSPPVNALTNALRRHLMNVLREIAGNDKVDALVLSGGTGRFIAGADIREMEQPPESPVLPELVAAFEAMPKPVVAAMDGPALGGGLEIALACDFRIASPSALLGLPETNLGIIPGAGGTQRLPRLVGKAQAISLICGAKLFSAAEARNMGVVDEIAEDGLMARAISMAPHVPKRSVASLPVPAGDPQAEESAAQQALKRGKGLPAIAEAIRVIRAAGDGSFDEGLKREREAFLALRGSDDAAALRHLFRAERESWKAPGLEGIVPRPLNQAVVIGAGTMGVGIAVALADAGIAVCLLEQDEKLAAAGLAKVQAVYDKMVEDGRLNSDGRATRLARISASRDWSRIADADLVVEAAFEDMAVKTEIFRKLGRLAKSGTVLATNTSYLDVGAIADASGRPEDCIGLHFFSPANVMKLLEIIPIPQTAPAVTATAFALARKLHKQPILAGNCDGFIGNRIYAVYRREAEFLVEDGAAPEEIDAAMEEYGFAMGIFAVSDLSGLDIAYAMRKRRAATRDPGERYVAIADRLCAAGRLGRKTGAGWYSYEGGLKRPDPVTAAIIAAARAERKNELTRPIAAQIQSRLLAVMANEGARVLADGIAIRASDIDVAFVNGYGFPRRKGGPMWAADRLGLQNVLRDVEAACCANGKVSQPAPLLVELARTGGIFSTWSR